MTIKLVEVLEHAIVGKLVETLIEGGFRVELCDQDGGGLHLYAGDLEENNGAKPKDGWSYWVRLVPGNGADIISDYTINLEALIKPVNAFASLFAA